MNRLTRRRLVLGGLVVCLMLSVLVVLSACGSSATGVKSYTSDDFDYSFEYPAAWKLEESDSADFSAGGSAVEAVGVYDPKGAVSEDTYIDLAQVTVYKLTQAIDASMMPLVRSEVEQVLSSLEAQATDLETLEALSETTVGGMSGFKVAYSFTQSGTPTTSSLYFLFFGDTEYQLTLQAATENWSTNRPVFDALVASFRPTGSE